MIEARAFSCYLLLSFVGSTPGQDCNDCNGDGQFAITDSLVIAQLSAGMSMFPPAQMAAVHGRCDLDDSGRLDIIDALTLAQRLAGLDLTSDCPAMRCNPPARTWTTGPAPPFRTNSVPGLAYDARRGTMVLFGKTWSLAIGDTWEWNGSTWAERFPATSPPSRLGHGMAFDAHRGVIVVYGGQDEWIGQAFGDLWEWDGSDWVERALPGGPWGGRFIGMAYDSLREEIAVWVPGQAHQVWYYDGNRWTSVMSTTPGPPSGLTGRPLTVFDPARNVLTLVACIGHWEWDGARWTEVPMPAVLTGRWGGFGTFEPCTGRLYFGGGRSNQPGVGQLDFDDLWSYEAGTWTELQLGTRPFGIVLHTATAMYPPTGQMLLVGPAWTGMWRF